MPVHDWTRVNAGLFHHFHQRWIGALCDQLNTGVLPDGFFALAEQNTAGLVPDILTLAEEIDPESSETREAENPTGRALAVATVPPRTRFVNQAEADVYAARADRIAVRHPLGNVVAVVEIVSPGNKAGRAALRDFVAKGVDLLRRGVHLLIVDLFPPSARDPNGIHGAIWAEVADEPFVLPDDAPLTLVSYSARSPLTAYVEPVAVGSALPEMPLFLDPSRYVSCPLEPSYLATWQACPRPFRDAVLASGIQQ